MPHDVEKKITVAGLREHDVMIEIDGAPLVEGAALRDPVAKFERKQTWGYVHLGVSDKPTRIKLDTPIVVLRSEQTEEEKASQRHAIVIDTLRDTLRDLLFRRDVRAELEKTLENFDRWTSRRLLDWNTLPDMLRAQALRTQALDIRQRAYEIGEHMGHDGSIYAPADVDTLDERILIDAFASWWFHQVASPRRTNDPLSRSTSAISNLIEDLDAWAIDYIANQFGVQYAQQVIQPRIVELYHTPRG